MQLHSVDLEELYYATLEHVEKLDGEDILEWFLNDPFIGEDEEEMHTLLTAKTKEALKRAVHKITHPLEEKNDMNEFYSGMLGVQEPLVSIKGLPIKKFVPAPPCHHGNRKAFTFGDITFYGGGTSRGASCVGMDVVINLTTHDSFGFYRIETNGYAFTNVVSKSNLPIAIRLPIEDMNPPSWGVDLYDDLLTDLEEYQEVSGKTSLNVLACCSGGHGRTGTFLSALLAVASNGEIEDPIETIRAAVCANCVESKEQEGYVADILKQLRNS